MGTENRRESAVDLLRKAGLGEMEIAEIMRSAYKNRCDPVAYADRAIRFRDHVIAGNPL